MSLDSDECILGTSSCSQLCNNTIGSYVCGCNTGYTLGASNITCDGEVLNVIIWLLQNIHVLIIDIDECGLGTSNCTQLCSNTIGSYLCGCNNGYILGMDNITCNGKTLIYIIFCEPLYSILQTSMNAYFIQVTAHNYAVTPLEATYVVATLVLY